MRGDRRTQGPLHGGAPSEVVDQLAKVGSPEHAEQWINEALDRGERLMGFGHRVYRAYDPRAAALRTVAESMEVKPQWLDLAIKVEDVALRILAERHPERPLKTNVEFYAAPVLMGVGLAPDLPDRSRSRRDTRAGPLPILEQAAARLGPDPAGHPVCGLRRCAASRSEPRGSARHLAKRAAG